MAEVKPLNSSNISILDGDYKCTVDTITYFTLADNLISNYQFRYSKFEHRDSVVCNIKLIDPKNLRVRIIRNGLLEYEKVLKGKIHDNYFYIDNQTYKERYFGFILKVIEKRKSRIGVLQNDNLIFDNRTLYTSSMFFIRGRHIYEDDSGIIYQKTN